MAQSKTPNRLRANGADDAQSASQCFRFINPHRLFHGVWLPQWLEERPEVSEAGEEAICLPDLLRGRQRLRMALVQSSG